MGWNARVLSMIKTGQRVYMAMLYIEFLVELTKHTSYTKHLKGGWAIYRVCEAV